jgi:hypothetical protein
MEERSLQSASLLAAEALNPATQEAFAALSSMYAWSAASIECAVKSPGAGSRYQERPVIEAQSPSEHTYCVHGPKMADGVDG